MKELILLTALIFSTMTFSQNNIYIGAYQDPKLAFFEDDHGNQPFTLDFKAEITLQGNQMNWYYFEMRVQYEYADLYGGKYVNWQVLGGWTFNRLFLKNLEIGIYPTIGLLHRFGTSFASYGATSEIMYKIGKFKVGMMSQGITRPDIDDFGFSNYVGIKYVIK